MGIVSHLRPQNIQAAAERAQKDGIRELAQKPHEPHAAFGHCAKLQGFCRVLSMFL
jgi:hypothetical protein